MVHKVVELNPTRYYSPFIGKPNFEPPTYNPERVDV